MLEKMRVERWKNILVPVIKVVNESYKVVSDKLGKDNGCELLKMGITLCLFGHISMQECVKTLKMK